MKVLFILGKGRSGSTLLDVALNSAPGIFSTGELWSRWGGWPFEDYTCGCGVPVSGCELWSAVLRSAKNRVKGASGKPLTSRAVLDLENECLRWRDVPHLLITSREDVDSALPLSQLCNFMSSVYAAIHEETGAQVIVDSSKLPFLPGPLGLLEGIDPFVLHLVRDSRPVAFSWQREKTFLPNASVPMPTFGPMHSSISWMARNLVAEFVGRRLGSKYLRMRYEDFVTAPKLAFERISQLLKMDVAGSLQSSRVLHLEANHTMWGNKSRFRTGRLELRSDSSWIQEMSSTQFGLVTGLTAPLLVHYGYHLSR